MPRRSWPFHQQRYNPYPQVNVQPHYQTNILQTLQNNQHQNNTNFINNSSNSGTNSQILFPNLSQRDIEYVLRNGELDIENSQTNFSQEVIQSVSSCFSNLQLEDFHPYNFKFIRDEELIDITMGLNLNTRIENNQSTNNHTNKSKKDIFYMLFNENIRKFILENMNRNRIKRIEERKKFEGTKGRKVKFLFKLEKSRRNYLKKFRVPWEEKDLEKFLGCLLTISSFNLNSISSYWKKLTTFNIGCSKYFRGRLSKYMFQEMWRCINFNNDDLFKLIRDSINSNYKPTKVVCVDESMVPHKGHWNPHHVFIKRKPHPNGIQIKCIADQQYYIFDIIICKRTNNEPPFPVILNKKREKYQREELLKSTPVATTVSNLISSLDGRHTIVGDSWFGNLNTLLEVSEKGHNYLMRHKSDRSSDLFKNFLFKQDLNQYGTVVGEGKINSTKFKAYAFNQKRQENNSFKLAGLVSTYHDGSKYIKTDKLINGLNGESIEIEKVVPEAYYDYIYNSDCVDQANSSIMSCYYKHRIFNWRQSMFIWYLSLLVHNSRVLYNLNNEKKISQIDFINSLSNEIYTPVILPRTLEEHIIQLSTTRTYCKACYHLPGINEKKARIKRNTKFECKICGHLCDKCNNSSRHWEYFIQKALEE
ncbi:hypothetical protein ABK040_001127 [Willaertia magna]